MSRAVDGRQVRRGARPLLRLAIAASAVATASAQVGGLEPGGGLPRLVRNRPAGEPREFRFTRAAYNGFGFRSWTVDYPKADRQFLVGLRRLTGIDASGEENPVRLDDPDLSRHPFLYAVEVGHMSLSEAEVQGLRRYLLAGGFLMADDFWGSFEWQNFEGEIHRVLPGRPIVELTPDHPVFSSFYRIGGILQVPNVGNALAGGPTWEKDGFVAHCRGIFDDQQRLMVVINWNTDIGDAWEWAENPYYPLKYSTYAYQMGVNTIVYAMSH